MGEVAQKVNDLCGGLGHFGHDRDFAKIGVTQELRLLAPQGEDLADERGVVEFSRLTLGLV